MYETQKSINKKVKIILLATLGSHGILVQYNSPSHALWLDVDLVVLFCFLAVPRDMRDLSSPTRG